MADCWDDGIIVIPEAADGSWMTEAEIDFVLNDQLQAENPAFRHYVLECLRPHMEHISYRGGVKVSRTKHGFVRYTTDLS